MTRSAEGTGRPAAVAPPRAWAARLIRNTLLWLVPVAVAWVMAAPIYNRVLLRSSGAILRLFERPAVTDLLPKGTDDAYVVRRDFPPARALVYPFHVTDVHFHLILLGALFLAVPGVPWQQKLTNLGIAVMATVAYDIVLVIFIVKATYATHLGAWSAANYGLFARNFYAMGRHLLDLPLKLALPLLLWCAFYLPRLSAAFAPAGDAAPGRARA